MIKYLRAFKTQEEYLTYSASTAFTLDNVSSCREGDLVYYTSENCGGYIPPTPATGKSIANAVVTCDSATYNGSVQTAQNIVVTLSGNTLIADTDYTITENTGGTNAGNYLVKVDGIGHYSGTTTGTFVINKATPTYNAPTAKSLTYNTSAQELLNSGSVTGGTIQYSNNNSTWSASIPSKTNAGTYTTYWKIVGDSNHNNKSSESISTTIKKVTPTVVAPTAKALTYNGSAQELVNSGSTNYGTLKYSIGDAEKPYDSEVEYLLGTGYQYIDLPITPNSNTGIYIKVKPIERNYSGENDMFLVGLRNNSNDTRWCIAKNGVGDWGCTMYYGYGGYSYFSNSHISYGNIFDVKLNYLNSKTASNNGATSSLSSSLSFTPSYPIRLFGSSGVNGSYSKAAMYLYSCKISQGSNVVMDLIPVRKNGVGYMYDKISGTLYGNNGTSSFGIGPSTREYTTSIPSRTNAGTYTVYYKVEGNSNVNDVAEQSVVCSIAKANSSLSFAVTNITVDVGETKSNPVTVNAGDGIVTYSSNNTSIVTVDNNGVVSGVASGNTTVSANISSTNNYNSTSTSYSVSSTTWDIVAKFNVTDTSNPTKIGYNRYISGFSAIEIDGIVQPNVVSAYTFSTTGEHTVRYKLTSTSITNDAFYQCSAMTTCTIGSGVTSIGNEAFMYCSSLTSIDIPDSVTSISNNAFNRCSSLTSIVIPNGVTSIGWGVFYECSSLTSIDIPDSVTSIGNNAFEGCSSLTSITIPNSVTSIGGSAFMTIGALTSITIPNSVTSIGQSAFNYCGGLTSITVEATTPPTLGSYAFNNTNNCPIYVPCDSVDTYKAASGWSTYASRIQAILGSCWDITAKFNVTDTSSPTRIASATHNFSKIKIDGVEQPSVTTGYTFSTSGEHTVKYRLTDKTSIVFETFRSCYRLTSIDIPDSVTSIGYYAFYECIGLTSVTIPNNVTSIGYDAFYDCIRLTSVTIPDGVTSIGEAAFSSCVSLTSCTIGSGVTSIGNRAFDYCIILTSIDIPDSVTSIGDNAFESCSGLTSCTIGSGVTSIGDYAFDRCSGLTSIISNATTAPTIQSSTFRDVKTGGTLTVPVGSTGYDVWMGTGNYYLGLYNWTKVEQ